MGWVPGFSGINSINNKPGLTAWMQGQILDAAWGMPLLEGAGFDEWAKEVKKLANERGNQARDKGLEIHDAIEHYIKGSSQETHSIIIGEFGKYILAVETVLEDTFSLNLSDLEAETTFASREGYGGMADGINRSYKDVGLVLDWKTKDKEFDDSTKLAYDDHGAQLAAYRH
jgi:hypothetical protein